ncbi:MAG TPA: flavin reductase family protein [Thermoanaerobaculaceae bacterium]|nr:flavin reductase family protein [Thermoanaerobaculaceae bacterium]
MRRISPQELAVRPFWILDRKWALLVAGRERPNPMTVSWGGFGTLWDRPVATVYVRPSRFTYSVLDAGHEFTLNFLPEAHRGALDLCGKLSGRDADKWGEAGLHRVPGETVGTARVAEAELCLECRALATVDLDPERFLDPAIHDLYPRKDYHRAFIGEVLTVWAETRYLARND